MEVAATARRLKRSESFFGIHFDFHASDDCTEIGRRTTPEMIENVIRHVRPDYIQCDCKGHRGLSSYPTDAGHRAPGFALDPLRIWREATAKHGVSLYMHYSGVWDTEAVRRHPEWARIDAQGNRDPNNTSVFGPYVDLLLIPQLKELSDKYGVDGVWVDGECWSTAQDYGEEAQRRFREQTGIEHVPKGPEEPYFYEFTEFCRQGFRDYLQHYAEAMHRHNPEFEIASNWAYSSFMPEPVTTDVDFISGDYTLQNSVNSARLEGRCMTKQDRPWDLMAWSFSGTFRGGNLEDFVPTTKSVVQLQQEASMVLSLGGGFQAYFQQKRDGSIAEWQIGLMSEVATFCRERQAICHRAEAVPQIGLIYSTEAYYRTNRRLFAPWEGNLAPMQGVLNALLDNQYSVEILTEHQLEGNMDLYPVLVLPEWGTVTNDFRNRLLEYAAKGGNLLLVGPASCRLFEAELGLKRIAYRDEKRNVWLEHGNWLGGMYTVAGEAEPDEGTKAIGRYFTENDTVGPSHPAATVRAYGSGRIGAVYFDCGERYMNGATPTARDFMGALVSELFPNPIVRVSGSRKVDVNVNRKDGKLLVHLVNTSGPHADPKVYVYDEVPKTGPLEIAIRCGEPPKKVWTCPANVELPYAYESGHGEIRLSLPELALYDIIVVEQGVAG